MSNVAVLMNQPATLVRVGQGTDEDDYGHKLESTTTVAIKIAMFPESTSEARNGADQQTVRRKVYLPAGLAATGTDRLTVDGEDWHFDGAPADWRNPRTMCADFAEATIWRVTG